MQNRIAHEPGPYNKLIRGNNRHASQHRRSEQQDNSKPTIATHSCQRISKRYRRKSVGTYRSSSSNLDVYYGLKENANITIRTKTLLEAAIANLKQREDNYSKKYIIQQMYNQRLLSPRIWDNLRTLIKDLEYEQLVIEAEAELLKPGWNIFSDANKMLPHQKKREEKMDKENRTKENSFLLKKKETLENQLMTKLTAVQSK